MNISLSPRFEDLVRASLGADPHLGRLAAAVLQLSDFYHQHPGSPTPWEQKFARPAYLSYFLPLNYARLRAAWHEVQRFLAVDQIRAVWDFGSGLGTTQWVLEDVDLPPRPLVCLELSRAASDLHRDLHQQRRGAWDPQFKAPARPAPGTLAVFSYSFLEMQNHLPRLEEFDHLLILEPSTRDCGRQLMQWRARFIEQGFNVLAPCTHAAPCPLLTHSARDWCHQRTAFNPPAWWLELEAELPMRNRSLTYSYLLLSRTVRDDVWRGAARVIGDTLPERGKTRQLICQGPEREFVSWLHRHGDPPMVPHGALLRGLDTCEPKGGERRVLPTSQLTWTE